MNMRKEWATIIATAILLSSTSCAFLQKGAKTVRHGVEMTRCAMNDDRLGVAIEDPARARAWLADVRRRISVSRAKLSNGVPSDVSEEVALLEEVGGILDRIAACVL